LSGSVIIALLAAGTIDNSLKVDAYFSLTKFQERWNRLSWWLQLWKCEAEWSVMDEWRPTVVAVCYDLPIAIVIMHDTSIKLYCTKFFIKLTFITILRVKTW